MIEWMFYSMLAATLLAGAARAAEEGARMMARPRRWSWLIAMGAAFVLPLLYRLFPAERAADPVTGPLDLELLALLAQTPVAEEPISTLDRFLAGPGADLLAGSVWALAAVTLCVVLLVTYRRLAALRAAARRVHILGVPALLTEATGPLVVGLRRPEVVVPLWIDSLTEEERRLIVVHEREHACAGDPRLLFAAAVLIALMPWNLPLWWMRRRLRQGIEVDCDARVLHAGADPRRYGGMLIRTAGRPRRVPLLAPALVELPSLLERRIIAMTSPTPRYRTARLGAATTLAALLVAAACELTPRSTTPSPTEPTLAEVLGGEEGVEPAAAGVHAAPEEVAPIEAVVVTSADSAAAEVEDGPMTIHLRPLPAGLDTGGADPVIVVDGQRVASLEGLDPARVQSITVLKDEAAVSAYGVEGEEGVVIVELREAGARSLAPGEGPARVRPEGVVVHPRGPSRVTAEAISIQPAPRAVEVDVEDVRAHVEAIAAAEAVEVTTEDAVAVSVPVEVVAEQVEAAAAAAPRAVSGEPLIIVEGEVVASLAELKSRFQPEEIGSIQVLKDASATAAYGERGRNGVIIVELKN